MSLMGLSSEALIVLNSTSKPKPFCQVKTARAKKIVIFLLSPNCDHF
jgi:hypothetical protein